MKTFYATTPIYYVNDLPHIGHIYSTVVTDTATRYHRLIGEKTRFLTGTDEHGQNIEKAAAAQGMTPIARADSVVARYHDLWKKCEISNDDFIRTTEKRHRTGVEALISRIEKAGDLYTARHEGWYCASCEAFYTEKELDEEKRCPVHGTPCVWESEENVFFRLSKYAAPLLEHYEKHPEFVRPETRRSEMISFMRGGLTDLSVSRSKVKWGIPFPGRPGQVVYVWLDALTNYVTALGFGSEDDRLYQEFWNNPEGRRVHLIGKDILRFHAVYWPAFLLSAGLPLPTTVWAHGWWLRDEKKMSKSIGNVVRPDGLVAEFGADALRYFLLREMTFGQDAHFSDEAFLGRFNADLANDLGNTVSRVAALLRQSFGGTPPEACDSNEILSALSAAQSEWRAAMEDFAFNRALEAVWRFLTQINGYVVAREPWKVRKEEGRSARLSRTLYAAHVPQDPRHTRPPGRGSGPRGSRLGPPSDGNSDTRERSSLPPRRQERVLRVEDRFFSENGGCAHGPANGIGQGRHAAGRDDPGSLAFRQPHRDRRVPEGAARDGPRSHGRTCPEIEEARQDGGGPGHRAAPDRGWYRRPVRARDTRRPQRRHRREPEAGNTHGRRVQRHGPRRHRRRSGRALSSGSRGRRSTGQPGQMILDFGLPILD